MFENVCEFRRFFLFHGGDNKRADNKEKKRARRNRPHFDSDVIRDNKEYKTYYQKHRAEYRKVRFFDFCGLDFAHGDLFLKLFLNNKYSTRRAQSPPNIVGNAITFR